MQAAFAQMRTPVGPQVPTSVPMYHPGTPGMGPQMPYYGQHPSGPIPLQVLHFFSAILSLILPFKLRFRHFMRSGFWAAFLVM